MFKYEILCTQHTGKVNTILEFVGNVFAVPHNQLESRWAGRSYIPAKVVYSNTDILPNLSSKPYSIA